MTKDQILDDLKYARDVAEQGRFSPLLGGRIGLMWGILLVPTLSLHGAIASGLTNIPYNFIGMVWMVFGITGGILTGLLSRSIAKKPGAQSVGNQVEQAVWSGAAFVLFTLAFAVAYSVLGRGRPVELFDMIMGISFGTQAISYYVLARISGGKGLYLPMFMALAFMAIVVAMIGNPYAYFVAAIGVVFTVIIPALTHLKNEPRMSSKPDINIDEIDDIIHGRLRLGIMAYLSAVNPASFPELLSKTGTSNGNLSTHLTKLESAGFIRQEKGYKGKRPQTLVHLTEPGRKAWIDYLDAMRRLLET